MRGKKLAKLTLALCLTIVLAVSPMVFPSTTFAATLSELQEKQSELQKQKDENDAKIASLQEDIDTKEEYITALQEQQDVMEQQIDTLNLQIQALDSEILKVEEKISGKQESIDANLEKLKDRLYALYVAGEASTLEIILSSENLIDFAQKTELLKAITEHDMSLIQALQEETNEIASEKQQIEDYKKQVADNKKNLDKKSLELSTLVEETRKAMEELNTEKSGLDAISDELEGHLEETDAEIDAWYEDYYASQNSGSVATPSGGSYVGTGTFTWPMPGFTWLSSYWGDGRNHKGIDIAGAGIYGQPIVAADAGTVIYVVYSGWGGGYGLCVYLDHGNGYSTRYAHMSAVQSGIAVGQTVEKGDVIGYVGSTGDSSGPHLHFEIRYNGVAQDPMQWFS